MIPKHSRSLLLGLLWVALLFASGDADAKRRARSTLYLDGSLVYVYWSDGDTFRVTRGSQRGLKARLKGFNTLESYGPVHRWGSWTAKQLYWNARAATKAVRKGVWRCSSKGKKDRYNRVLVSCPGLTRWLVRRGLAHIFGVPKGKDKILLKLQKQAQLKRRGMWKKGTPPYILTSVHSTAEGQNPAYNRWVSTKTGKSTLKRHRNRYGTCRWVCTRGAKKSCLLYVPFRQRYGRRRARCLRRR